MAKKPQGGGGSASIEPEANYRVRLRKPVERPNGRILKPRNDLVVKGKALAEFIDAVADYERV